MKCSLIFLGIANEIDRYTERLGLVRRLLHRRARHWPDE